MQPIDATLAPVPTLQSLGRLLVVDDEPALLRANVRILETSGYSVVQAANGNEAGRALDGQRFDAIVTDICMPGMNGIQLLRKIREHDSDVPVLLVTANPAIESAVQALELGALRYLIKPVARPVLVQSVEDAVRLGRLARMTRETVRTAGATHLPFADRASMEASLNNGLATLWMAYQPIVNWKKRSIAAYEALVRTEEPKLPHPGALLSAAERLGRVNELGRMIRATVARDLAAQPRKEDIFVNLHPADLQDESLYAQDAPLTKFARQIVLEITERQALDATADAAACAARLRALGYRLAIDDLGAGYSGLTYFAQLTPEVAKIDMALVRNIHAEPVKQTLAASLITLCNELGVVVVAEGVEVEAERDTIAAMGCDLFQGYWFARPGKPYPDVQW